MSALQEPNLGFNYGWALGEDAWNTGMDANLVKLGALLHLSVLSRVITTPPASPAEGDRYIIPAAATGVWAGRTGQVTGRVGGAWAYYTPTEGWSAWSVADASQYTYHSGAWVSQVASQPYDLHATFNGRPDGGLTLIRVVVPRATTFPISLTGSYAKSEIAATISAVCPITKNGASIGSINWGAGGTVATFTMGSAQAFIAGDVLELMAPSTTDVTLADLAITLVGWR